ncbi:MAG: replication-associated recombination protein A, partial [Bacteroidales bacterium]|nr:replication-associated recombination protein A [Bacteroidales bacterium]
KLMKEIGYGDNYEYAHQHEGNFIDMEFMPDQIKGQPLYQPGNNARENQTRTWLKERWKQKYGY